MRTLGLVIDTVVNTGLGRVRGLDQGDVVAFRGIPFAAPPQGPLRFRPPAPPAAWDGVRDCTEFGSAPPQLPPAPGVPPIWRPELGLDCLTLNVCGPDLGAAGLPVMVWIYGGLWKHGSSSMPQYDARALAGSYPAAGPCSPRPSSTTVITRSVGVHSSRTVTSVAAACLIVLVRASWTMRYAATSASAGRARGAPFVSRPTVRPGVPPTCSTRPDRPDTVGAGPRVPASPSSLRTPSIRRICTIGTNYYVAGLLVERLTGRSYAHEVRERIIKPLRLRDTYVLDRHDPRLPGEHAHGYVAVAEDGTTTLHDVSAQSPFPWAEGGLISDSADLAHLISAIFQGRVVPSSELNEMFTVPKVRYAGTDNCVVGPEAGHACYSAGLMKTTLPNGLTAWGKTGSRPGYTSGLFATRDLRRVLVDSLNPTGNKNGAEMPYVMKIAAAAFDPDLATK